MNNKAILTDTKTTRKSPIFNVTPMKDCWEFYWICMSISKLISSQSTNDNVWIIIHQIDKNEKSFCLNLHDYLSVYMLLFNEVELLPEYVYPVGHLKKKKCFQSVMIILCSLQSNLAFAFLVLLDSWHKHYNSMLQLNHLVLRRDCTMHEAFVVVVDEYNNKDNNSLDMHNQYTCWSYLNHRFVQHFDRTNNTDNTNLINRLECLRNIRITQLENIRIRLNRIEMRNRFTSPLLCHCF